MLPVIHVWGWVMNILVNIDVPELAPAIAFYTSALDLRFNRMLDDDVAELTGASSALYLLRNPAGTPISATATDVRRYARHWTPVHLDFVVPDLKAAERRALAAGAVRESACVVWRGSKCITFSDPFGHGFCLIEFAEGTYSEDAP